MTVSVGASGIRIAIGTVRHRTYADASIIVILVATDGIVMKIFAADMNLPGTVAPAVRTSVLAGGRVALHSHRMADKAALPVMAVRLRLDIHKAAAAGIRTMDSDRSPTPRIDQAYRGRAFQGQAYRRLR